MTSAHEIILLIRAAELSIENIHEIQDEINYKVRCEQNKEKSKFKLGDSVEWSKNGTNYSGKVIKINSKNIKVQQDGGGRWTISPSCLLKV